MKKFLLLLIVFIILSNCEISPRKAHAGDYIYGYRTEVKNNMTYGIWYVESNTSQTGYDSYVVNLTKDALEVELLKLQIEKLKNEKSKP